MAVYKEIVTKAVIGKGKKSFSDSYTVTPETIPTTVLGCWVINHAFKGYPNSGKIVIDGSFCSVCQVGNVLHRGLFVTVLDKGCPCR